MEGLEDGEACYKKASSGYDATTALTSAIAQDLPKIRHDHFIVGGVRAQDY